jgi:glycosyltransferase involved in cell wall biosynthesis
MRIAYVAAGAGGMYCGSCLHDNTLAASLQALGHDVALLPTYTPMRTDEESVSRQQLFYGAINVYLQHRSPLFRRLPRRLSSWLDRPALLHWVSRWRSTTDPHDLGALTLEVLRGEQGPQRGELDRLTDWLEEGFRPDVVYLTNSMFLGMARQLKERLGAPIVVGLVGEDLFIDQLPERARQPVLAEMRRRAADADLFIAPSRYYAATMAALLEIPEARVAVVPLGVRLDDHSQPEPPPARPFTIGFLARICPEKGLHLLVDAFLELAGAFADPPRLRIAGYLDPGERAYHREQLRRLDAAGLGPLVEAVGEVDRAGKLAFLRSLDVLSVPTVYREPKGLFALEAMAAGVPVVLPEHGSFPELLAAAGGGDLFPAGSVSGLAAALRALHDDPERRRRLGERGRQGVRLHFSDERMAETTASLLTGLVSGTLGRTA